jgi:hypothetical protein
MTKDIVARTTRRTRAIKLPQISWLVGMMTKKSGGKLRGSREGRPLLSHYLKGKSWLKESLDNLSTPATYILDGNEIVSQVMGFLACCV